MAPIIHEIDPDPDTVIILKRACTSFAQWEPVVETEQPVSERQTRKKKPLKKGKKGRVAEPMPVETPPTSNTQGTETHGFAWRTETSLFGYRADATVGASSTIDTNTTIDESVLPSATQIEPAEPEEEGIHYHVSSRHLMLASSWFKRALTKEGWTESGRSEQDGRFHIEAHDWDAEAFLILLRIFHLRNRQVPRTVTLEMLAKIAVLVDYYDCGEAIELFTTMWIGQLKKVPLPSTYCRDLVLWICASWIFDVADQFEQATVIAIKHGTEPLRTLDLPIPGRVSGEIDSKRYQTIESVIQGVHSLLDRYRSVSYACPVNSTVSFQCGSFLLGALTKELDALTWLNPRPEVPFPGLSFEGVCEKVRTIKSPLWAIPNHNGGYYYTNHPCTLSVAVTSVVTSASGAVVGLNVCSLKKGVTGG